MHHQVYTQAIKLIASLSAVYAVIASLFAYQVHSVIVTSALHLPLALFSAYAAFATLPIDKRFSAISALFALLNAGLI